MQNTSTYTIAAVNDEHTTCECCGRTGLKKTAQLINEAGDVKILGTTCAASFLGSKQAKAQNKIAASLACPNLVRYVEIRKKNGATDATIFGIVKATVSGATDAQIAAVFGVEKA